MPIEQPRVFKQSLNQILAGIVLLGGSVAAWCYWGHHFWTALKGPTEVSLADIAKLEDPRKLPSTWIKIKFDKGYKSKVVLEEVRNGNSRVDEEYILFQAGERWMIASVPANFQGNEVSGQIWRNNASLAREAVAAVAEDLKDVHQGKLFPFELNGGDHYGTNWMCFGGMMAFFAATGGFVGFLGIGGIFASFRPDPATGMASEYAGIDPQTTAAANEAMARFLRDANRR
jgi:hypothetical protein